MRQLPLVRDYMATRLWTLSESDDIYKAIELLIKKRISGAPVVDENRRLVGVISEKDCFQLLAEGMDHDLPKGTVGELMTTKDTDRWERNPIVRALQESDDENAEQLLEDLREIHGHIAHILGK